MVRTPCCEKIGLKKGKWTAEEDEILINYIQANGEGSWRSLPKNAGLLRCGKSCRLRWINYLKPGLKRGNFTPQEDATIVELHRSLGSRWSEIASHLPGRTDNELKNYWNSHLSRKLYCFRHTRNQTTMNVNNKMMTTSTSQQKGSDGGTYSIPQNQMTARSIATEKENPPPALSPVIDKGERMNNLFTHQKDERGENNSEVPLLLSSFEEERESSGVSSSNCEIGKFYDLSPLMDPLEFDDKWNDWGYFDQGLVVFCDRGEDMLPSPWDNGSSSSYSTMW
ncbi:hypothetical protein LguiA_001023 [Lonicera macranthoides]